MALVRLRMKRVLACLLAVAAGVAPPALPQVAPQVVPNLQFQAAPPSAASVPSMHSAAGTAATPIFKEDRGARLRGWQPIPFAQSKGRERAEVLLTDTLSSASPTDNMRTPPDAAHIVRAPPAETYRFEDILKLKIPLGAVLLAVVAAAFAGSSWRRPTGAAQRPPTGALELVAQEKHAVAALSSVLITDEAAATEHVDRSCLVRPTLVNSPVPMMPDTTNFMQTPGFGGSAHATTALGSAATKIVRPRDELRTTCNYRANSTKVIGDWADGTVGDAQLFMYKDEIDGGISQYRVVHPRENSERYGEEYSRHAGSTDNVYLIKPEFNPWVLIGAFDGDGSKLFFEQADDEIFARLGHLILQYYDGQEANFIEALIAKRAESSPPLLLYCATPVVTALNKSLSRRALEGCRLVPVKTSTTLDIEEGRIMSFVLTPTLKLPEALVAFDPKSGTLFSGKFFSAHVAVEESAGPMDAPGGKGWETYAEDWYHFFDCYFFTKTAQLAIRKIFMLAEEIAGPDVQQLAPLHGPVAHAQAWKLMAKYEAWTERKLRKDRFKSFEVLVMYASAYSNTKTMAFAVAKGLSQSGVRVVDMNLEHCTADDVEKALESANGFCIGSPTLGGEMPSQVKEALGVVLTAKMEDKMPCGVFGSFGWSGEAVDELQFRLKDGGFPIAFDPIRAKFKPTEEILNACQEAGVRLSQKLSSNARLNMKKRARKVGNIAERTVSSFAIDAFNKIQTCQAVMSSKDGDGQDVLSVAPWINQASFDPPGITISVPKPPSKYDDTVNTKIGQLLEVFEDNGVLTTQETASVLKEVLEIEVESEWSKTQLDKALKIVDPNNDGEVTLAEVRAALGPGGTLRPQVAEIIKSRMPDDAADSDGDEELTDFVVSLVPFQSNAFELCAAAVPHKKEKANNQCVVLQDCHAYMECKVTNTLTAGDHLLIYAEVVSGKVLDATKRTEMVDVGSLFKAMKMPAMAATGTAMTPSEGPAFAGATVPLAGQRLSRPHQRTAVRALGGARGGEETLSSIETWTGLTPGKEYRLQTMRVDSVAKDTNTIRSLDWDRDRFDIEFALERGTTYNSYIIKGTDKTAIVDTSHEKFEALYFAALANEVDLANVHYLIVSHTEPDHSGLIGKLVEMARDAGNEELTVVGSKVCINFLEGLIFTPLKTHIVGNNDKIDLGGGHELEFVIAPNLHWPDTMFTFDHGTGVLFTCDAFGMHYCSDELVDAEGFKELLPHYALYYDCLMKPNARSVLTALKKVSGFEIKSIATGHGPMLSEHLTEWVDQYRTWSETATKKLGPSVAVFWISGFAQSERLAQLLAHGLTSSNVIVEMQDLSAVDIFEITECLARNEVVAIFAPPQGSRASANVASIVANCKPKKHQFMILDSFGSAEQDAIPLLRGQLQQVDIPEALLPMEVNPDEGMTNQTMQAFEEAGIFLARKLTQKEKVNKANKANKELVKALGRISNTLFIATAKKGGVRHAMVASWATPASLEPLGVSLTIAKERAMEPLLRIGDSFTLNILEEGRNETRLLMKHFLQAFAPGVDRLEGVDCFEGPNGAAVLRGAFAYLECKMIARMDAGDHWVGYAEVVGGKVAREDATAATHHRKLGTYY